MFFFYFTDKVLYAYPLDELTSTKNSKAPDRLKQEITDPVHFFQTGVCNGMELLVAARQRTVSTSFIAFKPERHVDSNGSLTTPTSSTSSHHHHHHTRLRTISQRHLFRHHGSRSSWFSTYKVLMNAHFPKRAPSLTTSLFLGILGGSPCN